MSPKVLKNYILRAWKDRKSRLKLAFALFLPALLLQILGAFLKAKAPAFFLPLATLLFVLSYGLAGHQVLRKAGRDLLKGRWMTVFFLMSLATLGALALREWAEAAAVMIFYELGEYAQQLAVKNSQRSIAALLELAANTAVLWRDGSWQSCDPDEAKVGERLLIGAGQRVALDCVIVKGSGDVDESALTGESLPRPVDAGDKLLAGTMNLSATLEAEVLEPYESSALNRILELTEEASLHKARMEQRIARFARIYTPAMVILALAMLILPPLLFNQPWRLWFQRSLNLLVISCPCALVLSVPLSYFAGLGLASSRGILVKGSDVMERFTDCRTFCFDKTGTLSSAELRLCGETILDTGTSASKEEFLALAAALEQSSRHPIALALRQAAANSKTSLQEEVAELQEQPGRGLSGRWRGVRYALGNARLLQDLGLAADDAVQGGTSVWLVREDREILARFDFRDSLRSNASDVLRQLRRLGAKQLVLLSGDRRKTVEATARELGLDAAEGELLPEQKLNAIRELQKTAAGGLAYVGDGINDAPSLALADVGLAMGGIGSDAAIEAADIVLMRDDLAGIPEALNIARKTVRNANENIVLALGIKLLVIVLSFFGIGGLWAAVFADVGVTLLAVGNALRLRPRHSALPANCRGQKR